MGSPITCQHISPVSALLEKTVHELCLSSDYNNESVWNNRVTTNFKAYVMQYQNIYLMDVNSHKGTILNELADIIANQGLTDTLYTINNNKPMQKS